ncbi:peptidase [Peribacillus sp. JNUCC41]|uniref:peptidase n=1 Tax=Peribacillus sp. JNUCC41 TaxID=2778370 RepID=UPI001781A09F|nr:peptidase [Brevibacillus sp. JNUCC-41]QOS90653.1 peptidase [Brevibacillus sp. JNUCC-41]
MQLIKEQIQTWLKEHYEEGTELLQRLVQSPSISKNEAKAQSIITEVLSNMGLKVDAWEPCGKELTESPYFCSSRADFTGSPNVVGVLPGTGGGRSIILNGHIDVVPEGDHEQWTDDPYSGAIKEGKMYGRGVTDMKGGLVSFILALQAILQLDIKLRGDVIFQSVIEEESGGTGTLSTILKGYKADAALITEPTNMRVFPKQQGSMWFRIFVKGRSAHGGTRYEGVSAFDKAMVLAEQIRALEFKRNQRINDPLYEQTPIPIPINIGVVSGGNWPSSVPDLLKIEGRMGIAPNEKIEDAQREMKECLQQLSVLDPWFKENPPVLEWFGARWLPGEIDLEHDLMNTLVHQYRETTGEEPVIEASPWGTDGGLLTEVGKIPTVVFGPGTTEMAHFPDEYIELDKVFKSAEIIALTIIQWCSIKGNI